MVFLLWQGYWMVEILDQFKKSEHPAPTAILLFIYRHGRHPLFHLLVSGSPEAARETGIGRALQSANPR